MTNKIFVLGIDIFESAATGVSATGAEDDTCINLITAILTKCHKLLVSRRVWEKYKQKFLELIGKNAKVYSVMLSFINITSTESDKVVRWLDSRETNQDVADSRNEVVNLAIDGRAVLVTQDLDLAQQTQGLEIIDPSAALILVATD